MAFTQAEIDYLASQPLGRLATVGADGQPDVVAVAFEFDGTGFWVGGTTSSRWNRSGGRRVVPGAPGRARRRLSQMRNEALETLDVLVGEWTVTMSDAWFLEPPGTEVHGSATIEWFGEAFVMVRMRLDGEMSLAIGRSDANDAYEVLSHDDRGVCRVFAMTWDGRRWALTREDPDFHQRLVFDVEPDRLIGRTEASEDEGRTWRKDFDLLFERTGSG